MVVNGCGLVLMIEVPLYTLCSNEDRGVLGASFDRGDLFDSHYRGTSLIRKRDFEKRMDDS